MTEGLRAAIAPRPIDWIEAVEASRGRPRRHQRSQELWKSAEELHVVPRQPEVVGRERTSDDGFSRSADDNVRQLVGHACSVEAMSEADQPGNEILAAAAEHQSAILAFSERGIRGDWHGRPAAQHKVRLRVA